MPCAQAHGWEVYATFALDPGEYPGKDAVFKLAEAGCTERFEGLEAEAGDDETVKIYVLIPSSLLWRKENNRTVNCLVGSDTTRFTDKLVP